MTSAASESRDVSKNAQTTLGILNAIEFSDQPTQRSLANRLGIALGLTNAVIKRCIRKGYLKVQEAPAKRYAYYITPRGFQEKSRLTAQYLFASLDFFRKAKGEYSAIADYCEERGWMNTVLIGATELAEIAYLSGTDKGITFRAVIDQEKNAAQFCGMPVVNDIRSVIDEIDAVILTSTADSQILFDELCSILPKDRVLAPNILHISQSPVAERATADQ